MPNSVDDLANCAFPAGVKSKLAKAIVPSPDNFGFEIRSFEKESLPGPDFSSRADQRLPQLRINAARKQDLDA